MAGEVLQVFVVVPYQVFTVGFMSDVVVFV